MPFFASKMILLAPDDLERPIDLLDEQQPDHLVGKGHAGKGEALPRRRNDCRRQTESAPDQERDVAVPGRAEPGDIFRQFFRGGGLPRHIEHDQIGGRRHFFQ